jgi:cytidylate kinase
MPLKFTVAIDGPAAAGKGTISKAIATAFGFAHLDTGALYRGVGLKTLSLEPGELTTVKAIEFAQALSLDDLHDEALRTAEVAQAASKVAVMPEVRAVLLKFQTDFANRDGGSVLDGRDIGTVICPNAHVKLFITASAEVRAERRFLELDAKGHEATRDGVLADVIARDTRDKERSTAPLIAADDAVIIDTSELPIDQAIAAAVAVVQARYRRT